MLINVRSGASRPIRAGWSAFGPWNLNLQSGVEVVRLSTSGEVQGAPRIREFAFLQVQHLPCSRRCGFSSRRQSECKEPARLHCVAVSWCCSATEFVCGMRRGVEGPAERHNAARPWCHGASGFRSHSITAAESHGITRSRLYRAEASRCPDGGASRHHEIAAPQNLGITRSHRSAVPTAQRHGVPAGRGSRTTPVGRRRGGGGGDR